MNDMHYLTPEGKDKLEKELEQLKTEGRIDLAKRLKHAISMGDLSENADYHKAKEDQGFLEGRIQEIESILHNAEVIETPANNDRVTIGSSVTVQEADYPPETYLLLGTKETDPRNGKISHESPFGKALLGHKVDDLVQVNLPNGEKMELKIISID